MKRTIIILASVALLALVAFRLISNKQEIDSKKQVRETNVLAAVNVAEVKPRISERNLNLVGTVAANKVIDIKSEVQGKITSLNFELGDYVPQGRVLARVDDKIRAIGVANAEQQLADARQNFERYTNLYEGGAATKAQYDQFKLAYENARNQVEQAKKELSTTAIVAPISGYITNKTAEAGAFATMGAQIATIVDVSKLKVTVSVAENDVYALKEGDPVQITATVYPGVTFNGKITFISQRGDEAHNYPVEISLDNQEKNPLRAGTYVNIAFNRKNEVATLQIPRESLVGSVKNAQVYVVTDGLAQLRKITVGADNGAYLEVLNGLTEGEKVVTTGQINLTDSTRVSVIASAIQ
jgi:membrane fusion protein, multidrug efflux system